MLSFFIPQCFAVEWVFDHWYWPVLSCFCAVKMKLNNFHPEFKFNAKVLKQGFWGPTWSLFPILPFHLFFFSLFTFLLPLWASYDPFNMPGILFTLLGMPSPWWHFCAKVTFTIRLSTTILFKSVNQEFLSILIKKLNIWSLLARSMCSWIMWEFALIH